MISIFSAYTQWMKENGGAIVNILIDFTRGFPFVRYYVTVLILIYLQGVFLSLGLKLPELYRDNFTRGFHFVRYEVAANILIDFTSGFLS